MIRQAQLGPVLITFYGRQFAWLRLGRWVIILRSPRERPLFSERHGYMKVLRLGGGWRITARKSDPIEWRVRWLKRDWI